MNTIFVNFDKTTGKIKPLHGVCCAPYEPYYGSKQPKIDKYFKEGHIPFCRLHDCLGRYGGTHYIDIPNIFPDFSADETDPASYDFYYSDEYIKAIQESGCEAYYRLGVTIDHGSKKYTTQAPPDFKKWARICEHIIMHYNQGWANGFTFGIQYWEIWNEPENPGNDFGPAMWAGTREEFYELYHISSKYLKQKFPEIRIGGYGSCGFYTLTRNNCPDSYNDFIPYFTDFLKMVREKDCPLDFFSWHIYTDDEKELLTHARYVRETLDDYGFENTESHLNEWNYNSEGEGFAEKHTMAGASFDAAVLSILQNTSYVDKAMYYCFSSKAAYNGFLNQNDGSVDPPWYSFVAFGRLYELGNCAEVLNNHERLYAVAAKNEDRCAILISNFMCEEDNITLRIDGLHENEEITLKLLTTDEKLSTIFTVVVSKQTTISFRCPRQTVVLLEGINGEKTRLS